MAACIWTGVCICLNDAFSYLEGTPVGIFPAVWNEQTRMPLLQYVPGLCQKLSSANVTLTFTRWLFYHLTASFRSGCQTFGTVNRVLYSLFLFHGCRKPKCQTAVERAFNTVDAVLEFLLVVWKPCAIIISDAEFRWASFWRCVTKTCLKRFLINLLFI